MDAHGRHAIDGCHQAALDGGGADGREDIAAALRVGNDGLIDKDLEEETVDVGVGPGGG